MKEVYIWRFQKNKKSVFFSNIHCSRALLALDEKKGKTHVATKSKNFTQWETRSAAECRVKKIYFY